MIKMVLARAKMTENGKLTPRFSYLQDYVDGKKYKLELNFKFSISYLIIYNS
jgi:hypothetical protein